MSNQCIELLAEIKTKYKESLLNIEELFPVNSASVYKFDWDSLLWHIFWYELWYKLLPNTVDWAYALLSIFQHYQAHYRLDNTSLTINLNWLQPWLQRFQWLAESLPYETIGDSLTLYFPYANIWDDWMKYIAEIIKNTPQTCKLSIYIPYNEIGDTWAQHIVNLSSMPLVVTITLRDNNISKSMQKKLRSKWCQY